MSNLNINILENLPEINIAENINQIFDELLHEVQSYLKLDIINSLVKIKYVSGPAVSKRDDKQVLDLGVKRDIQNNYWVIEILDTYEKFLPFILLREAYYCFVPEILKNNETIKIFINQIVENDLQSLDSIKEWNPFIRNAIVNYDFLSAELDRIEKFLKLRGNETIKSGSIFFFEYIRRNPYLIHDTKKDFYPNLKKEFLLKISKSMNNDEIIETLYVLINIFYKVKSYRALLEYQKYFTELKKSGVIETDLSLRKFIKNMHWINTSTYIAPSYQINWKSINIASILCQIKFHPLIKKKEVDHIINKLPFFVTSKSSVNNFAIEISGWFIIPRFYIKDLINLLNKMERFNYIIEKNCFIYLKHQNNLNLNYFREFYKKGRIINPTHIHYDKKYEISFDINHRKEFKRYKFSLIEFLVLDRVKYLSIAGFTFEKTARNLNVLKSDLINEIISQRAFIKSFKKNLEIIHTNRDLKNKFLSFLKKYQKFGFFYIKELLDNVISSLNLVFIVLSENPSINNIYQFQDFVNKRGISQTIEENIIINIKEINRIVIHELLSKFFLDKIRYEELVKEYHIYKDFFTSAFNLKVFNLKSMIKIIDDSSIGEKIYITKEKKLERMYERYKLKNITIKVFNDILDKFLNIDKPLIKPILITTIITTNFANYYIQLILRDSPQIQYSLEMLKSFFPRVNIDKGRDLFSEENLILVQIYLPNLEYSEKGILVSILYNLFKDNIIYLKKYFYDGFLEGFSRKNFYDFEEKRFFYTKDLFEQFFIYVQKIFGKQVKPNLDNSRKCYDFFWSTEKDLMQLVDKVNDRISREQVNLKSSNLNTLLKLHLNLENIVLNNSNYMKFKNEEGFKKNIQSISFKPQLQAFGLSKYYLYIRPTNLEEIDLQLLFVNTFKKVKYAANIDSTKSLLIQYIFPKKNPNLSYVNWITRSKKIISEFCLFSLKKLYQILHFNYNLTPNGWDLDSNKFKSFFQKVLFNPNYSVDISHIKQFNLNPLTSANFGPESSYFKDLTQIYAWSSTNLKSILTSKRISINEAIQRLLKQKLIFPYLKLKNIALLEKIDIIIPEIKPEFNEKIVEIFSFFNVGFIYQIECKYFISGFESVKISENGLFIKIYLPNLELSKFKRLFDLLFQYLNVDYIILNDMIDGNNLLKNVFGNLNFLKTYNPLKNLIWNEKDKIWMNHKLFNEKFEPIYPGVI